MPTFTAALVLLLATAIGLGVLLLHEKPHTSDPSSHSTQLNGAKEPSTDKGATKQSRISPGSPSPQKLRGDDEDMMHLIEGGTITLPASFGPDGGKVVRVDSFYLDETFVTNHQYVDFLNKVLPRLKVESGVVRGDGQIWFFLGEVEKGYEPIVYEGGEFHVQFAPYASNPVLRVTGYGASAYVSFYGRRLVTELEWLYAVMTGNGVQESPSDGTVRPSGWMMDEMNWGMQSGNLSTPSISGIVSPGPSPVILSKPNRYGIRGLNESVGEWGVRSTGQSAESKDQKRGYVILGGLGDNMGNRNSSPPSVSRHPWEAFEEVGFRCARNVSIQNK